MSLMLIACRYKLQCLSPGRPFQLRLIFVGKARRLTYSGASKVTPGVNLVKMSLFCQYKLQCLSPGRLLKPSLTFVGKARSLPESGASKSGTWCQTCQNVFVIAGQYKLQCLSLAGL
jgi:hypothetical protein